ncbi:MAG: sodium:glutamate symporter [Candidatus Marinimicrobia bacterium]|nr:sodium:glutamate symporter [Candidatus Neomarinimicrobiota bacterium]
MNFQWDFFIDFGIISFSLLLATFLRYKIKFLQKYLIPNSLTAGFFLLVFYNFFANMDIVSTDNLGTIVYHFLSISFIAMTLKNNPVREKGHKPALFSNSISLIFQYAIQAIIGLLVTFILIKTHYPNLFPSFGFFVPLGFAQGPGQSFAIGKNWETMGFEGAGSVGLTFAAIGFLYACFGGVWLINYGIKKEWLSKEKLELIKDKGIRTGLFKQNDSTPEGSKLTSESEAIDTLTLNFAMVFGVYLLSFLLLKLITFGLSLLGQTGVDLGNTLWGINFVFSALMAIVVKSVLKLFKINYIMDNGMLNRVTGFSVDFMVTASIGAISIAVLWQYIIPIIITSLVAGFAVIVTVPWFCSRIYKDHQFDRMLLIYGASTGTMPTGLALLRVVDPDFETPAASDYMFSTGITFPLVIPFILAINLPAYAHTKGDFLYFWLALGISFAYLIFSLISFLLIARRKAFHQPSQAFYRIKEEIHGM